MSDDVIVINDLPPSIVAIQHSTIDRAMALCQRSHDIKIPAAKLDEQGCRSALTEANVLYNIINDLSKELEKDRLERGREITAVKERVDAAVKAATKPLEEQRAFLGQKIAKADRELKAVIAEKLRIAEEDARRREAERQRQVEETRKAAEKARADAAAAEARAAEAKRKADEQAAAAAAVGKDAMPDDSAIAAAAAAEEAKQKADAADQAAAVPVFEPIPQAYVAPAPKSAVRSKPEYSLAIDDLTLVPREIAGAQLWTLNEGTALRLLKIGVEIPGLRLIETESTGAKGRSNAFAV